MPKTNHWCIWFGFYLLKIAREYSQMACVWAFGTPLYVSTQVLLAYHAKINGTSPDLFQVWQPTYHWVKFNQHSYPPRQLYATKNCFRSMRNIICTHLEWEGLLEIGSQGCSSSAQRVQRQDNDWSCDTSRAGDLIESRLQFTTSNRAMRLHHRCFNKLLYQDTCPIKD
jgi:hypothetical protein